DASASCLVLLQRPPSGWCSVPAWFHSRRLVTAAPVVSPFAQVDEKARGPRQGAMHVIEEGELKRVNFSGRFAVHPLDGSVERLDMVEQLAVLGGGETAHISFLLDWFGRGRENRTSLAATLALARSVKKGSRRPDPCSAAPPPFAASSASATPAGWA